MRDKGPQKEEKEMEMIVINIFATIVNLVCLQLWDWTDPVDVFFAIVMLLAMAVTSVSAGWEIGKILKKARY